MKTTRIEFMKFRRRKRNDDLIKRMKQGAVLHSYDAQSSWFPPRPVIKKDKKALAQLYETDRKDK